MPFYVRPDQLETDATTLRGHAATIRAAIEAVNAEIDRMNAGVFAGQRADALRAHHVQLRELLLSFCPQLERTAGMLEQTAADARFADQKNQG